MTFLCVHLGMAKLPLAVLLLSSIAFPSDDKTDRATLRGVNAVCVVVDTAEPAGKGGIRKEQLQTEIEGKLLIAGIPADKNATACLYLNVRAIQAIGRPTVGRKDKPIPLYAVDFRLEFVQTVALTRDPAAKTFAPTWSVANMGTVPAEDLWRTAREMTDSLIDKFVAAYRSVNPQ